MAIASGVLPGRYRDPQFVGRGGMAEVYCAHDTALGRPVAVKLLSEGYAANADVRERFGREALAAARLSGEPNIVTVYDVGEWRGRPFIVMEYVPHGSLEDVLRREGAQPPARALRWLEEAATALDRAHRRGVVHRDVKPANLLLDDGGRAQVADFGIASAAGLASLTETGTVLGTAGYLAPEQAQGDRTSAETDEYGLAVVAFELLTGSRPFQRESPAAEAAAQALEPIPSASARNRRLPTAVDDVFRRALAKRPQERFASCTDFVAALHTAFSAGQQVTGVMRPPPRQRRSLLPLLFTFALLALVAGGIAAALFTGGRGAPRSRPAERITVTEPGTTVHQTVTAQPPPSTAPQTTTSTTTPSTAVSSSAGSAAQRGYEELQAGDAAAALPLLRQASQELQGTNSLAEAYNDYNLAVAIAQTSGCSPEVLQLLDASEAIQGHRGEINRLRNACRKSGND